MDAAVSCSALAWLSVRAERSWLPCAISELAVATPSEPERTVDTTSTRLDCICCKAASIRAVSLSPVAAMSWVRSPLAMWCAMLTASLSGAVMALINNHDATLPSAMTTATMAMKTLMLSLYLLSACPYSTLTSASCSTINWFSSLSAALMGPSRSSTTRVVFSRSPFSKDARSSARAGLALEKLSLALAMLRFSSSE